MAHEVKRVPQVKRLKHGEILTLLSGLQSERSERESSLFSTADPTVRERVLSSLPQTPHSEPRVVTTVVPQSTDIDLEFFYGQSEVGIKVERNEKL